MKKASQTITLTLSGSKLEAIKDFYREFAEENPNPYLEIFAHAQEVSVSIYKPNKKGIVKAVFQGPDALKEAKIWDGNATPAESKPVSTAKRIVPSRFPQIGSDEVGTGDFFGPVCVCAAYVREEDLPLIKELGIGDSKQMDDSYILQIGPKLIHTFSYSQIALTPEKYNEVHDENNMNAIKAKMHNACLGNLLKKFPNSNLYLDQFAEEKRYYSYLKDEESVVKGIVFQTKGESHYPSIALASVIARYSFLRKMRQLSDELGIELPFGAGPKVDEVAKLIVERFGIEKLREIAKCNFKNYQKLR